MMMLMMMVRMIFKMAMMTLMTMMVSLAMMTFMGIMVFMVMMKLMAMMTFMILIMLTLGGDFCEASVLAQRDGATALDELHSGLGES